MRYERDTKTPPTSPSAAVATATATLQAELDAKTEEMTQCRAEMEAMEGELALSKAAVEGNSQQHREAITRLEEQLKEALEEKGQADEVSQSKMSFSVGGLARAGNLFWLRGSVLQFLTFFPLFLCTAPSNNSRRK